MATRVIPEVFQQLSQQVDCARDALQQLFDDEYGAILDEHVTEKKELTQKIELYKG